MHKWTSCQYDSSMQLVGVTMVGGGMNPKYQVLRHSYEYENSHHGCSAIEVEGGVENCPLCVESQEVARSHTRRR